MKTIIIKLSDTTQWNEKNEEVNYRDESQKRLKTYSEAKQGQKAIFSLANGEGFIFADIEKWDGNSYTLHCNNAKCIKIPLKDFNRINAIQPEINGAKMRMSFRPFWTDIDVPNVINEINGEKYVRYYIVDDNYKSKITKSPCKDRIIIVKNNIVHRIENYAGPQPLSLGKSLPDILEQFKSTKNINKVKETFRTINEKLGEGDYYEFPSFDEYYDRFFNKRVLSAKTITTNDKQNNGIGSDKNRLQKAPSSDATSLPLNLILYGPPGTGKTYNTLYKALEIIKGKDLIKDKTFEELKPIFDNLVSKGQIVFTTFHQSMSYEDFIEGIKPKTEMGSVSYEVQPGIFKQICENAKKISVANKSMGKVDFKTTRVFKMSLGEKDKDADAIFRYCVDNDVIALGWGKAINFSKCKKRADFQKLDSTWGAAALEIFKEWMKKGDIVLISDGTKEVKGIAQVTGEYEFRDDPSIDMHQFRRVKWLYTGDNIPVSKLYDKNLSQQSIYGFYKEKNGIVNNGGIKVDVLNEIITGEVNEKKQDNYVLIIDEINRGNVSQIFGELITLIEKDKRIGKKEALSVTLPYSQTSFGVPDNLYIIGTMNTADRSVEALDTALRRRFSFEEMMPNPELLGETKVADIKLKELLITINKRIVALKDREHQIGHSYFMDCPDDEKAAEIWLNNVFKDKIIPLLQEYFYGDYKKIYYVLGGGFVKIVSEDNIFAVNIRDDFDIDEKTQRYEIKSSDEIQIGEAVNTLMGIERKNDSGIPDKQESETGEESEESKH